jgi:hypothetical protein
MATTTVSDLIKSGERSRLIPVVAETSKEERAIQPLLAAFSVVPSLANSMLQDVGGPTNQRATVNSYSQVVFKDTSGEKKLRPDGFLEVDSGRKTWRALIEAKIGSAELSVEQIEAYLDLARELEIDAVITVSNQFSTIPTHHPVAVNKQKLRSVDLYHFSWLSILTKARLLSEDKTVDDPEQSFILKELIRYLSHPASGVCEITRLGGEWKNVCNKIQTGTPINKADADTAAVVSQWHQLTRYLALELSTAVGKSVDVWLPRAHAKDPAQRLAEECANFVTEPVLGVELDVPNAASRVTMEADFLRRSLRFSITLNTPQDRTRPAAAINWATRQLSSLADTPDIADVVFRVRWPYRAPDTVALLAEALKDPKGLVPPDKKDLPAGFLIQRVVDLGARFKGSATFVEDASRELPRFYKDVVQNVANWVAKAPTYREPAAELAGAAITPTALSSKDAPIGPDAAHAPPTDEVQLPEHTSWPPVP